MPKVSVVIPSYNYAYCLPQAIESVLNQTFQDYELIVVDDGSTDDTQSVVASYGDTIRYMHQENRGLPGARNTGICAARGQYVAFLDPDDLWLPAKLDHQVALLDSSPEYGLVYCNSYFVDGDTGQICGTYYSDLLKSGWILRDLFVRGVLIGSATPIARREVLLEVGGYDESLKPPTHGPEDWDLYLRIAGKYQIGVVPEVLAVYRLHGNSMMASPNYLQWYSGVRHIIDKIIDMYPEELLSLRDRKIAEVIFPQARAMVQAGLFKEIRQLLFHSFQRNMLRPQLYWYFLISLLGPLLKVDRASARQHFYQAKAAIFRGNPKNALHHFLKTFQADPVGYPQAYMGFVASALARSHGIDLIRKRWDITKKGEAIFWGSDAWRLPSREPGKSI